MAQEHWEKERLREISRMKNMFSGFDPEHFGVNERVKTQAPLQIGERLIPQWSMGIVTDNTDGQVKVRFDNHGEHAIGAQTAGRFLIRERRKTPSDTFREQYYRELKRDNGLVSGLQPGSMAIDESGNPLLVSGIGPRGLRVEVTTHDGATFVRAAAGLVEAETDGQGALVKITGVSPENHKRHYPMYPGEESSIVGTTGKVQFTFTPENGEKVYRVLTQYGPKDFSDSELSFVNESRVLGLAPQPSMGVTGGVHRLTAADVAPYSPGTRINIEGREGTVMEKFDASLMVSFDDGQIEYVEIEEIANPSSVEG